jgi:hypothetical protein
MAVGRMLLMAVGEARRDVPCLRAGLACRGVIPTAQGEPGRDVLMMS